MFKKSYISFKNVDGALCFLPRNASVSIVTGVRQIDKKTGAIDLRIAPVALVVFQSVQIFVTYPIAMELIKTLAAKVTALNEAA